MIQYLLFSFYSICCYLFSLYSIFCSLCLLNSIHCSLYSLYSIYCLRIYSTISIIVLADVPLCVPGTMSVSGDAVLGPCSECGVGFYQVTNIMLHCNNNNNINIYNVYVIILLILYIKTCVRTTTYRITSMFYWR